MTLAIHIFSSRKANALRDFFVLPTFRAMANKKSAEILEVSEKGCIFAKNIRNIMAKRYLDPKADLTFKKVFGEHPDLVISLLNALLPLKKGEEIQSVEYLTPEMVPDNPLRKFSIVDVRCKDQRGRQFIVEMQMVWSPEFMQRVMFNSAKAYVRQLDRNEDYHLLEPVYSLNLVNDVFLSDVEEYYHYYRMVHEKHTDKVIDGLHLVFVELPKFTPHTMNEKKMQVLWLRYLTEIDGYMETVPQELLDNPEINKAMEVVEESAFSPEQLLGYDKFWDIIRTENTLYNSGVRQGLEKGMERGLEEGRLEGRKEGMELGVLKGRKEGLRQTARNLKSMGLGIADIQKATGLSVEEIRDL